MLILAIERPSRSSMVTELSEERRAGPGGAPGPRTHLSMQRRVRLGWVVRKSWNRVKMVEDPPAP